MEKYDIYQDIAKRTNGDIYIGVVGPVRTGKSTFISKFMEGLVLPNINDELYKQIATDEMPQSADGKTIMTSQPKFIPANAVKVEIKDKVFANVRLIDCVGYFVDGAMGHEEDGKPRLVKTPWSESEISFEQAAEIGTKKVISDYSTIGILVTTDGSFGEIDRGNYILAEERVVSELKALKKPFVIVLNCQNPSSENAVNLKNSLEAKYGVPVIAVNALNLNNEDISGILEKILFEFPMQNFDVDIPKWMQALPENNEIIKKIVLSVKEASSHMEKMKDFSMVSEIFENDDKLYSPEVLEVSLGKGTASYKLTAKPELFYEVLSKECGDEIADDYDLLSYVKTLSTAKKEYKRLKNALDCAEETGYGIVEPDDSDLTLEEPVLTKQSGRFGVKFKAGASTLHIIKVDVSAEVSPIVGSQEQSEELVNKLVGEYGENPKKILTTNIFGKTLNELIGDGLKRKANNINVDTQGKMRKTVTRIVNEGKGGVICILL